MPVWVSLRSAFRVAVLPSFVVRLIVACVKSVGALRRNSSILSVLLSPRVYSSVVGPSFGWVGWFVVILVGLRFLGMEGFI